jgi:subtilisin-like proprotein convertase family protein
MAAADVSGVLALMQDYFTNTLRTTPSPALLKAMLINGARPTGAYDLQVQNKINFEGWGLINLPDSLPPGVTNRADANCSSFFIDQNPTNALATGDSHTFLVTINTNAAALPLRVTLAWTDPPGDPAAAIKLVNNLDLVVTNFDDPANPIIFYGNDIASGSIYNTPEGTNAQNLDSINNVENVFISPLLGANYSITVIGRGVNVNAVTAQTNNAAGVYAPNVVQDFALVISSGNGEVTNVFTVTDNPIVSLPTTDQQITLVTNYNAPLLNQLVGASTPLLGTNTIPLGTNLVWGETNSIITLGMTNQWHFYVVTNTTGFTNAAFITFIPSTLAIPRMGVFADSVGNATRPEADIDLYVTTDPTLMNLNPVAISNCVNGAQVGASSGNSFNGASLGRGGTEFVVDTNSSPSIPGEVYYVGVYSEDREASEYGFIPIFSQQPFSQMNPNGSQSVFGVPLPVNIPDGTPALPGHGYVFGLALYPMQVLQVVVTNTIVHQNFGDLIGTMTHGGQNGMSQTVVLNNHDSLGNPPGPYTQIYDDSGQGNIFGSQPSDGPGSLNTFTGQQGNGVWLLTETDDSLTQIGSVTGFNMLVEPHQDLTKGITIILGPLGWFYEYIDVPPGATNLTIYATNITATGVVDLFVRYGAIPTLTATNEFGPARLTNSGSPGPGNSISIGPPLTPGRYWVGLYNESLVPQTVYIVAKLGMGTAPQATFTSAGQAPILDDAVMTNSIFVTAVQNLSSVEVALRVDHPRVSDLVFHLISPQGTRCLLVENRGGTTTNGMGATLAFTNITPASSSGNGLPSTNVIDTGQTAGTVQISYNFYTVPDEMVVQYQGANIFDSGIVNGSGMFTIAYGPGASTQLTIIMNPTVYAGDGDLWDYTVNSSQARYTYLVLTEDTNKTTTPIKYAVPPFHGILTNLVTTNVVLVTNLVPTAAEWHNSFELGSSANISPTAPQYFPEGWHVDSGSVDLAINGTWFGNKADEGTWLVDLDGSDAGTISTNIPTVPGQNYVLSFAYSRNADSVGVTIPSANVLINNNPVGTLVADFNNTWASLNWHSTSYVFTATSPSTLLTFHSLDAGKPWPAVAYGVLLDAINLTAGLNDDFEKTAAGDYAQGVNPVFGGWTVNANQVTVISNASLAYSGTNLLALADGVISRILPTVPGQTYNLSYAYRGPGAVALWRGESNAVDSISGNNGILTNDISFAAGEVNSAFSMGTNGFVFVPASPSLDVGPGPGFTIDGWVYPQNLSSPHPVVEWSQAGGLSAGMHFYVSSTVGTVPGCLFGGFIEAGNPGVGQAFVSSPNIVAANVLQHVALTYNHQTGNAAMYLNGVMVASTNNVGVVVPWTTGNVLIGRRINTITPSQNFHFAGQEDEISIYRRDLSASEIQAIFQKGSSGKYDTNAPSIATGLAEAQVTVGGTNLLFFGNNTKWRTTNLTFVATQSNTVLQITGIEPGMLLDNFALTQFLVTTNLVVATNLNGSDVYYLPEQSLDTFAGLNANGPWQLEIWDNRAGAGLTNTLVSWQLRFNFATNFSSIGVLTNGLAVTNVIPPGGMEYYLVVVPPNADFATNRLLFATGPLNVWFNQTTLPAGINPPDYLLIPNSTGGSSILSLTSVPTNFAAGGTYYLGVQNLGAATVTYGIEVDFHLLFPPAPPSIGTQIVDELTLLTVTNTASSAHLPLTYSLLNPPAGMTIDTNGVITWTPSEAQGPGFYTIQTIITDSGVPPLSTTNSFNVIVIEVNTPPFFLGTPSNQTINAFSTLIVTNAAGDSDIPANPLTYTLTSTVTGTNVPIIDVNTGIITWTPTLAQVLTTNAITTVVTDYNPWAPVNQHLSATNYFTVFVTGALSPFAFTQPATSVTGTSAQLNGMATPNGPPTTAWFEWGTSAGYGNQTPPASVGGSFNVVYVASPINGLVMNQPYHFRLVVSNVVGVVHGFDQIFDEAGVVAWGGDYLGQTNVPPGLSNVVAVAAAHDHSLALKNDGTVVAWGDGLHGQTNVPAGLNGVVAVAGGEFYSLALKNNGTVAAWGANTILGQTNVPAGLNSVVNIAGGRWSSLALKSNGQVVAWGYNIAGLTNVPAGLSNVVAVAGGGFHSMAVKNDGTVVAWGDNAAGQTDVPPGLSNVVAIAGGGFHSLALKYDGTVVAWGDNSDGQTDVPPGLSNVVAVAAGGFHSLVLKNDGSVLAWGDNSTNQSSIPTGLSNVVAISSGYFHNLALASPFNVNLTNTPPFWLTTNLPPLTMDELTLLTVTNTASDSDLPPQTLTYTVTMLVDTNAMITNGWPLNYATTNPPPVVNNNGVITWTPGEAQGPGVYIITAVVTDNGAPPLSATNSFTVTVNEVNLPPVLTLPPDTNIEEFVAFTAQATATDPDIPPNPLTFALVSGPAGLTVTTNGVITWTPGQPPGPGTYAVTISVTDTNAYALTNQSLSVTNQFNITVTAPSVIIINSITATNIGGTNGFLLQWSGPTNFQYEIQWTTNLLPLIVWHTVLNPVINVVVTSTNGHFSFFDDGTLTGGFGPMKFYRVLGGLNLGPITGSGPANNTVLAGATSQAVVAVPANAISASNVLLSATGPLNVWFNQTNPPTGNTNAGDFLMLSATSAGAFMLTSNSVPPLVPGTNYYLGFQNLGATNLTFVFQVIFGYPPVSISSVSVLTNGNFQLQWSAPTNYQFQVAWTTNLVPPVVWNYIPPSPPYITSVTTNFTFVDTNAPTAMKFYRLVEYP